MRPSTWPGTTVWRESGEPANELGRNRSARVGENADLVRNELRIQPTPGHQLVVASLLDEPATVEHEDHVGIGDRCESDSPTLFRTITRRKCAAAFRTRFLQVSVPSLTRTRDRCP